MNSSEDKRKATNAKQEAFLKLEEKLFNDADQVEERNEIFEYLKTDRFVVDKHHESEVAAFYRGRSVFITGASGFVGKVSSKAAQVHV